MKDFLHRQIDKVIFAIAGAILWLDMSLPSGLTLFFDELALGGCLLWMRQAMKRKYQKS